MKFLVFAALLMKATATICHPMAKYSCDASQASSTNPDGCNLAQEKYIEENCETTKMSAANRESIKLELTALTRQMMLKARNYSLCN